MSALPLQGKTALVTGASSGIGLETAAGLARDGATVVLGCRNIDKAREVADHIRQRVPNADLVVYPERLDLANPESIRAYAIAYSSSKRPLHILVNNAGANYTSSWKTADEIPGLVQTNYLGPYLLTRMLGSTLKKHAPSRVVNVTSVTHRYSTAKSSANILLLNDITMPRAYPATKLGNILFTYELQRHWGHRGVQAAAVDPGGVASSIWRTQGLFAKGPLRWIIDNLYYARGLFASNLMTRYQGSGPTGVFGTVSAYAWAVRAVILSLSDWPVRKLSKGAYAARTSLVPSSPTSYNAELAHNLWVMSDMLAKVPHI